MKGFWTEYAQKCKEQNVKYEQAQDYIRSTKMPSENVHVKNLIDESTPSQDNQD